MNVHARARASAQAIDRSATRLDPVVGLDDLLRRHRRQPLRRAAAAAGFALLIAVMAIWAGAVLRGPTPIQPTLGPVTRIRVGSVPVSVAVTPDAAWVLNSGNSTISRVDPVTGRVQSSFLVSGPVEPRGGLAFADGKLPFLFVDRLRSFLEFDRQLCKLPASLVGALRLVGPDRVGAWLQFAGFDGEAPAFGL